jgi:hypothetical protein
VTAELVPEPPGAAIPPPAAPVDVHRMLEFHAGPPGGSATRHLCAAAHLDREFRTSAIRELVENRHRVPAPAPGVETDRVLEHCLRARRAAVTTGLVTIAIGILGLVISPIAVLGMVIVALAVRGIGAVARFAGGILRMRPRPERTARSRMVTGLLVIAVLIAMSIGAVGVSLILPDAGAYLGMGVVLIVAWILTGAVARFWRRSVLAGLHLPASHLGGAPFPALRPVFDKLRMRAVEVDTIYGDFSPFAGSGLEDRESDWSFSIELRPSADRRKQRRAADPMEAPDLHRRVMEAIAGLRTGPLYPGDPLHRILVTDRIFRSGLRLDPPPAWFGHLATWDPATGRPVLDPAWADMVDLGAHERLRHYIEARVELWEYQIVASVFVRVHVQGNLLEMDGLATILPPVAARYRTVDDALPPDPITDGAAVLWEAVSELPADISHAAAEPWAWAQSALRAWLRGKWYRAMLAANRAVDHAPTLSVRELGAEPFYQQRFQQADVDRFFRSVARRAYSAVLVALRESGYDTSEFDQILQQNNNFNSGTQVFGSVSNVGQFAGGAGAAADRTVATRQPRLAPQL